MLEKETYKQSRL